jgi:thiol peroxidase
MERKGLVSLSGTPFTLAGTEIKEGMQAPEFTALNTDLREVHFSSLKGKVVILASVPSLDTQVCELETKRFEFEAEKLGDQVSVLVVSMDLPFAQKRWVRDNNVKTLGTLSDHRYADFGMAWGVLIKELRLLARAVFVVDKGGVVRYVELAGDISKEPDYDAVLAAAKALL